MGEKRNITISLQEAREWYKSNNKALREIAFRNSFRKSDESWTIF